MVFVWCFVPCNLFSLKEKFAVNMKLDTIEKEGSKNVLISIDPNSYISLSLLNYVFNFVFLKKKVQKFRLFFINELGFCLILNFVFKCFNY